MPLPDADARRPIHRRVLDMQAFARDDGLYDIEARLIDRKPFPFQRLSSPVPTPAGDALHDLWIRMTVDRSYVVTRLIASSDSTPWPLCKEATDTLSVLVGERIARGWSRTVKERLRGAAGCTHLMEMLIPMGTTALQGIRGLNPEQARSVDAQGAPTKLDTCFAYSRERSVVRMLWPEHARPAGAGTAADKG